MPFCLNCGQRSQPSDTFCGACGASLRREVSAEDGARSMGALRGTPPCQISVNRVLFMTFLSYGFYVFYWFYLTWRQYRDYTQSGAFPVWHSLSLLVPVYNLFRIHAHVRSFKELMLRAGLASTISAGWAVVAFLTSGALNGVSFNLSGGFGGVEDMTKGRALTIAGLDLAAIAIVMGLLVHVQANLNRCWLALAHGPLAAAGTSAAEVLLCFAGVGFWLNTLANVLSPAYRAAG